MAAPAAARTDAAEALLARRPAPQGEGAFAREARAAARARLRAMGAPTRRDEYWKYTDPATLIADPAPRAAALVTDETPVFDGIDALRLVFVDGAFRPDLSDDPAMDGVEITPLADALAADIHWAREVFGVLEADGQDPVARPLAALNTALARDGFCIRVCGRAPRPINLRYLHVADDSDAMIRNVVRVEAGGEATLLENGPAAARVNTVLEADIGPGARLHHVRAQGRDHDRRAVTHAFVRLAEGSAWKSFTLTVNGRLTRNEHVIDIRGDDAFAHVAGACVGDGEFVHDDTVFVTHAGERGESRQVFKKVLRNGARGVFQGKILVRPGAQKTDGYQISQALLLDGDSEFDAKPELEIYADDVACSHGSTCGAVDEEALFYLRARGVSRREAQNLLTLAFLGEAIDEIEDEALAEEMRGRVAGWMERRS